MTGKKGPKAKVGGASILKGFVIAMLGPFEATRSKGQYKQWIEGAKGRFKDTLTDDVTHLVVSEQGFEARGPQGEMNPMLLQGLAREDLQIVKPAWLDNALRHGKKPAARRFPPDIDWRKIHKKQAKKEKAAQAKEAKAEKESKRSRSKYVISLEEETDKFAPPTKKARRSYAASSPSDASDSFGEASRTAKKHILSEDYHHFVDSTGFEYDIMLVKVLRALNTNQHLHIKLYESNAEPKTYAVVRSTLPLRTYEPVKDTLVAPGAAFPTAFRIFKKEFLERTGVEWDHRYQKFKRAQQKPPAPESSFITMEEYYAAGGARATPAAKPLSEEQWEAFEKQPWIWRGPPLGEPEGITGPLAASSEMAE